MPITRRHGIDSTSGMSGQLTPESRLQRCVIDDPIPGRCPGSSLHAPLALEIYMITDHGPLTHLPGPKVAAAVSREASVTGQSSVSGWGAG